MLQQSCRLLVQADLGAVKPMSGMLHWSNSRASHCLSALAANLRPSNTRKKPCEWATSPQNFFET